MNVEPAFAFRLEGDANDVALVVEVGGEVARLGPAEAFGLALRAIEVASYGPRGTLESFDYWIMSLALEREHDRKMREVRS